MNYKTCTVQELAEFFKTKTTQAITQQLMYYKGRGNTEVVVKIMKARILCQQLKLSDKLDSFYE
jgi:hypothetical protein